MIWDELLTKSIIIYTIIAMARDNKVICTQDGRVKSLMLQWPLDDQKRTFGTMGSRYMIYQPNQTKETFGNHVFGLCITE